MKRTPCAPRGYIKLLVVDDDDLTRDGLRAALSAEDGFFIAEADNGHKALRYYKEDRPDVVLLDLRMPGMDGLETMRELNKLDDPAPIVIMTAYGDIESAVEAMKSGAYDFIVKPPKPAQLMETLRKAAESGTKGPASTDQSAHAAPGLRENYESLTDRERKIFKLTAEGLNSAQVAERLSINTRTAECHRENLMKKMNVHNKAGLVRLALRLGLIK